MPTGYSTGKMYLVNTADIAPNPLQPRQFLEEQAMAELTASVKKLGVLQPVLVRNGGEEGKFVLVAGERRYHAAVAAGLATVPAVLTDGDPLEISIVENLLRENFTAIEEAEAIENLRTAHSYQLSDLSQVLGKAESTLSEILSLNKLPPEVKNDCRKDPRAGRRVLAEIAKEPSEKRMTALYQKCKASGLTVGEIKKNTDRVPKHVDAPPDLAFVGAFTKRLTALELEKIDKTQSQALWDDLDSLRLEVNRKLKKLKSA
jgi:ParB family transcriptional regulator, chromosome partitioning protein